MRKIFAVIVVGFLLLTLAPLGCKGKGLTEKPAEKKGVDVDLGPYDEAYGKTFYVMVNYETCGDYDVDYKELMEIKSRLGEGGEYTKVGFMAVCRYMNETKGEKADFVFDPKNLRHIFKLSEDAEIPVVICLNGGPWGGFQAEPKTSAIIHLEQDIKNCQWRDDDVVPGDDEGWVHGIYRILTYNNLNKEVRFYQKRNLQAAVKEITAFYHEHPDLFVAITVDPEIFMSPFYYSDYNPQTIEEFQKFEKEKFKGDIKAFNKAMGTNFSDWEDIDPPRPCIPKDKAKPGNKFWEEWTDFRIHLVDQYVQDEVDWAREAGLPAERIYTHQTVRYDNPDWMRYMLCSPLKTAQVKGGSLGITTLQDLCFDEKLYSEARKASSNWGNFELNPGSPAKHDYKTFKTALETIREHNPHILCPYMWLSPGTEPFYMIKDSEFERAIRDFVKEIGDEPRG